MAAPLPTVMGSSCGHLASHFNCVSHRNAGEGGARVSQTWSPSAKRRTNLDLTCEIKGGNSMDLDWSAVAARAACCRDVLLENCKPISHNLNEGMNNGFAQQHRVMFLK